MYIYIYILNSFVSVWCGVWVEAFGAGASGRLGFRVLGLGFRVLGFGFGDLGGRMGRAPNLPS